MQVVNAKSSFIKLVECIAWHPAGKQEICGVTWL